MTVVRRSRSEEESGKPADEETNKESASEAYLQVQPEASKTVELEETCGRQVRQQVRVQQDPRGRPVRVHWGQSHGRCSP